MKNAGELTEAQRRELERLLEQHARSWSKNDSAFAAALRDHFVHHVASLRAELAGEVEAAKQELDDVTSLEFGWHERTLPTPKRIKFLLELLKKQLSDTQDEVAQQKELVGEWEDWAEQLGEVKAGEVPDWASVRESIGLTHFSLHRIAGHLGFDSVGFEHNHDPSDVADKAETLLTTTTTLTAEVERLKAELVTEQQCAEGLRVHVDELVEQLNASAAPEPTEEQFAEWFSADGSPFRWRDLDEPTKQLWRRRFRAARAGLRPVLRELDGAEIRALASKHIRLRSVTIAYGEGKNAEVSVTMDGSEPFASAILQAAQEPAK